jgi:RNA polymerase sigma-70 factor (ECF subfamily)
VGALKPSVNSQDAGAAGAPALPPAFDEVYEQHGPFVWRCLRNLGVPQAALEDAAQDVFLVVHRRLSTLEQASNMRAWLFGIVRNIASNQRRSIRRKGTVVEAVDAELAHAAAGPQEHAENAEAAAFIQSFLARLNDRQRDVFILGVIEELSGPEVATALSIPVNTAYTRLRAVRGAFRQALRAREVVNG